MQEKCSVGESKTLVLVYIIFQDMKCVPQHIIPEAWPVLLIVSLATLMLSMKGMQGLLLDTIYITSGSVVVP